MPPVLVCKDVIGEFMESCKREKKKKAQMLYQVLKTATSTIKKHNEKNTGVLLWGKGSAISQQSHLWALMHRLFVLPWC